MTITYPVDQQDKLTFLYFRLSETKRTMNELDLIKEVEKRPILYDKSVSGFNKTKLRDDAWKEVQEALNVTGE